jgi:hypothetical protein
VQRILLFATTTGYQTRAFGEAADALGVQLVFATDRCDQIEDPWRDGAVAVRFYDEDRSVDRIVAEAARQPIDGLIVVGDRPTVVAARAAERLRLPFHPADATAVARDKVRTRTRLRAAQLPGPWFLVCSSGDRAEDIAARLPGFPCVIKPVSLSGSRGVMRADDAPGFVAAFARLRALLSSADVQAERNPAHGAVLIEGFVPGREYALEGVMHEGELRVLAIFDKPDPLDGPFFEETIYLTPSRQAAEVQAAIVATVARAARAIGLSHGPVHAECRVNDDGVFVLEVAARPIGGLCARALRFAPASGPGSSLIGLEALLLRHALGEAPDTWVREADASGVMMMPIPRRGILRSVEGADAAAQTPFITDVQVTAKPDQLLVPLPEGASYLGFIFGRADAPDLVDRALREAYARLQFRIETPFPVLAHRS